MPAISIIIPTFNRAHLVCEAIESVLSQTYHNLEVVVVDDGSTDDTERVIRERFDDDRVIYLYQTNQGRSAARNRGVIVSSGRYLLFLDSDDLLLPDALQSEVDYMDAYPGIDIVYTDGYFVDEAGRHIASIASARPPHDVKAILDHLVVSNVITACHSALVRRSAMESVGPPYFDTELRGTEDEDLWIRLAAQNSAFAYVDVPTCKYRIHDSNASRYDPSSAAYWRRRKVVKTSRFKILNAPFFSTLRIDTQEKFFYGLLISHLHGDESGREIALNSERFAELPAVVRARLLYRLAVCNIVDDRDTRLGRERLKEVARLAPGGLKYRMMLLLSYLGRPLIGSLLFTRRWLGTKGRRSAASSPIGPGGLRSV